MSAREDGIGIDDRRNNKLLGCEGQLGRLWGGCVVVWEGWLWPSGGLT